MLVYDVHCGRCGALKSACRCYQRPFSFVNEDPPTCLTCSLPYSQCCCGTGKSMKRGNASLPIGQAETFFYGVEIDACSVCGFHLLGCMCSDAALPYVY